jgi:hypothetical protein
MGKSNYHLLKAWSDIPKFDGNPCSAVTHVVNFVEFLEWYGLEEEDELTKSFLISLNEKQRKSIKHISPKGLTILVHTFLNHFGPQSQQVEDTIHDLRMFSGRDPIHWSKLMS